MELYCNKNGTSIEDIFKNNFKCDYKSICAGCNHLVEEEECQYIKYVCDYEWEIEGDIIEGDMWPDNEDKNTPCDSIMIEKVLKRIYFPCDYGEYMQECNYEGNCPFKEEAE